MRLLAFFWITLLISFSCWAEPQPDPSSFLQLKGYLGQEELVKAMQILEKGQEKENQQLIVEVNSESGDLVQVLELAKKIYEAKVLKNLHVIVYLDDKAVGPAAIIPFLADELYCSLFVSWGDIPLGSEGVLSPNLLRNRVNSFINHRHPQAQLLHVLADAMSDPSLQVVNDQGWRIARETKETTYSSISAPNQTLVINQNQLQELNLITQMISLDEFESRYGLKSPPVPSSQIEEKTPGLTPSIPQNVEEKLAKFIHFNTGGANQIGHIYIGNHESSINQSTWLYVKQALDYYKKHPPIFIILEIDTPGGEVFAAQKISDALKEIDTQYNIPVVAFINNWAISAGAMLAYSCRFIAIVKDGSMGAAEPVYLGETGKLETASEKVNSALRSDFASLARFFDRNPLIAEAMVDKDLILVFRHGRIIKLDNENQIRTKGVDPDEVITPKGKLLTLNADEMVKYHVADLLLLPQKLSPITNEEQRVGVWPANKELLFQIPFFSKIPQASIEAYKMDWKTKFFVFLATPLVSSLLFMGLIIGAYMELNNPGLSLPGGIAALCLFLIALSSFSLEIADWLELILLLTGLALILVELFILPSFGLAGILGALLFIIGLFGMMLPGIRSVGFEYDTKTLNAAGHYVFQRLAWLCGALLLSFGVIALIARYVPPSFKGFRRLVLVGNEQDATEGFFAGYDPKNLPPPGSIGEVLATLRPAGKVLIKDQIYDAISSGELIEAGEKITITRLDGGVMVVSRLEIGEGEQEDK